MLMSRLIMRKNAEERQRVAGVPPVVATAVALREAQRYAE
jgi:hypothetical protein